MSPSQLLRLRTPAVSIRVMARSPIWMRTSTLSRVVPAISLTITRGSPASWFTMLLLPALRRPTMATRRSLPGVSSSMSSIFLGRRAQMKSRRRCRPLPLLALTQMGLPKPRRVASCAAASKLRSSALLATSSVLVA